MPPESNLLDLSCISGQVYEQLYDTLDISGSAEIRAHATAKVIQQAFYGATTDSTIEVWICVALFANLGKHNGLQVVTDKCHKHIHVLSKSHFLPQIRISSHPINFDLYSLILQNGKQSNGLQMLHPLTSF